MTEGERIEFPASRRKAAVLMIMAAFVVLAFVGVDWFRWAETSVRWAAIVFGVGFASYFTMFALALFFRRKPVFTADASGLGLPVGGLSLIEIPWGDIDHYEIVTRKVRLLPGLATRAFGVVLTDEAMRRRSLSESVRREIRLNRASMGVDILLTHWFAPVGFEEIRAAARRWRPQLDTTPDAAPPA
ncbi:MAG: hypothetical protein AAF677_17995 [Pseudomonadota bacterium]